jgi:hypothetical protein
MKRIGIYILLLLVPIFTVCSKTAETNAPAHASDVFVPDSATLAGFVNIAQLMTIAEVKNVQDLLAQQLGAAIAFDKMKEISFWVSYDGSDTDLPPWCAAIDANAIPNVSEFFEEKGSVEGITTLAFKDDDSFLAAIINEWLLIGTEEGIEASIRTAKGTSQAQSPRGKDFRQMMAKVKGGLLTIAFLPSSDLKKKLQDEAQGTDEDMDGLIKDFTGACIAADYVKNTLRIALAIDSSKTEAKKAAESIMKKKKEAKETISSLSFLLGEDNMPMIEKVYSSFNAKGDGDTLHISLELPDALLEAIKQLIEAFSSFGADIDPE